MGEEVPKEQINEVECWTRAVTFRFDPIPSTVENTDSKQGEGR